MDQSAFSWTNGSLDNCHPGAEKYIVVLELLNHQAYDVDNGVEVITEYSVKQKCP